MTSEVKAAEEYIKENLQTGFLHEGDKTVIELRQGIDKEYRELHALRMQHDAEYKSAVNKVKNRLPVAHLKYREKKADRQELQLRNELGNHLTYNESMTRHQANMEYRDQTSRIKAELYPAQASPARRVNS